jgi:hypothetical protein
MASILKLKAKLLQKSLSLKSLNGLRRAVRVPTDALLLATSVLLWPQALPAQHTPPTALEVEAFVDRAASEEYVGKEVRVPDQIFKEFVAGVLLAAPISILKTGIFWSPIKSFSRPTCSSAWLLKGVTGVFAARREIVHFGYSNSKAGNIEWS